MKKNKPLAGRAQLGSFSVVTPISSMLHSNHGGANPRLRAPSVPQNLALYRLDDTDGLGGKVMERTEHIDGTWRRPRLTENDIPQGFIQWCTVPHDHRHMYLYGGLYSLVEAFNQGRQDEARQRSEQIEHLSVALQVALAYVEDVNMGSVPQPQDCEAVARHIRVALRIEL